MDEGPLIPLIEPRIQSEVCRECGQRHTFSLLQRVGNIDSFGSSDERALEAQKMILQSQCEEERP